MLFSVHLLSDGPLLEPNTHTLMVLCYLTDTGPVKVFVDQHRNESLGQLS